MTKVVWNFLLWLRLATSWVAFLQKAQNDKVFIPKKLKFQNQSYPKFNPKTKISSPPNQPQDTPKTQNPQAP